MLDIRFEEDRLFEEWRKLKSSFVIDGCPNPSIFINETRKVVFILKDGNLGSPDPDGADEGNIYNQRTELEQSPTPWWSNIARWAYFLRDGSYTWNDAQQVANDTESIREILSHHVIVQLKKTWGGGAVSSESLYEAVRNDKDYIYKQISLYNPDFVVACGNGEQLLEVFDSDPSVFKMTSEGVRYGVIRLLKKESILIDYCHPSIRVGTKVKGIIAKGLSTAIFEIEDGS